jgi:hypothetical protein
MSDEIQQAMDRKKFIQDAVGRATLKIVGEKTRAYLVAVFDIDGTVDVVTDGELPLQLLLLRTAGISIDKSLQPK